jgi:ferritin-like metal-binding protein YciE
MTKINTLQELYVEELQILLSGEEQLIEALPKMARAAHSPALRADFEHHLEETRGHAEKLRSLLVSLQARPEAVLCPAMHGLIKAGENRIKLGAPEVVRDAALIIAGQRVEHFEIAGYGSARTLAHLLGHEHAAEVLERIEMQEFATDQKLTRVAEALNAEALTQA